MSQHCSFLEIAERLNHALHAHLLFRSSERGDTWVKTAGTAAGRLNHAGIFHLLRERERGYLGQHDSRQSEEFLPHSSRISDDYARNY
jgi:hypothetical protein